MEGLGRAIEASVMALALIALLVGCTCGACAMKVGEKLAGYRIHVEKVER